MSKAVVLFGAGASHLDGRSGRPPLGKDLFKHLRMDCPDTWGRISQERGACFSPDFEEGMTAEAKNSEFLVELTRDMAIFFSKVGIEDDVNEPYRFLLNEYRDAAEKRKIVFATLNYDCLLELAAWNSGIQVDYFGDERGIRLLKLHGSCNFWFDESSLRVKDKVTISKDGRVNLPLLRPPPHPSEVVRIASKTKFSPAMALYTHEKQILCGGKDIETFQREYASLVRQADEVLIVGARPNLRDQHVWGPLSQTSAQIGYIGGRQGHAVIDSLREGNGAEFLGERFEKSLHELQGFLNR